MKGFLRVIAYFAIVALLVLNLLVFLSSKDKEAQAIQEENRERVIEAARKTNGAEDISIKESETEDALTEELPTEVKAIEGNQTSPIEEETMEEIVPKSKKEIDPNLHIEERLKLMGLVDIDEYIDDLVVELRYATHDNFMGEVLYEDLKKCFLQREVADKLKEAQRLLKKVNAEYRLVVFDGCRPRSVQYKMWERVKGTNNAKYVANPNSGSMHNYGAAVDLSILDELGYELDMGTEYDFFGIEAQPRYEDQLFKEGKLNREQIDNRRILRKVMKDAGFHAIMSEWWHYNAFSRKEIRSRYEIVD